jgi:hypothetical protein
VKRTVFTNKAFEIRSWQDSRDIMERKTLSLFGINEVLCQRSSLELRELGTDNVLPNKENGPEIQRPLNAYLSPDTNRLHIHLGIHHDNLHTR